MATIMQTCLLHVGDPKNERVVAFGSDTWDTVMAVARQRKAQYKSSKYRLICDKILALPQYTSSDGYHRSCYKNFTAVSKKGIPKPSTSSLNVQSVVQPTLRSSIAIKPTTTSGIFSENCILCPLDAPIVKQKKYNREKPVTCETKTAETRIKEAARVLNDTKLLAVIEDIDFVAKEVKYHNSCRRDYLAKAASKGCLHEKAEENLKFKAAHDKAFMVVKENVNQLVEERSAVMLTHLHRLYVEELSASGFEDETYAARSVELKVVTEFIDIIKIDKISNKLGKIVFHKDLNVNEAYAIAQQKFKSDFTVEEAALILRSEVLKLKDTFKSLPYPLSPNDIEKGETEAPIMLLKFFKILFSGSGMRETSAKKNRLIESVSDDVIYGVTNGNVKPAKHCLLGLGMKSITGSRKVIDILNRFGHSLSYQKVEEIETDLALTISDRQQVTPDGMELKAGLSTGIAFDNYDENTETLSGKGTLHDTVGITYQNIASTEEEDKIPSGASTTTAAANKSRRKRSLETLKCELQPYRKKAKITYFTYSTTNVNKPPNLELVMHRDMIWMILSTIEDKLPMWAAWNSLITVDPLPKQRVCYLQNISLPPTRADVIVETLKIAQNVASECNEEYAVVTYDLGIAKPASQIQAQESPTYDNVFIMFGPFHIIMSYFGCLGYYIDGSGGDSIMLDVEILASGSLNGFISGKHYNRCKRLHVMLATSLHTLHFKQFIETCGPIPAYVATHLQRVVAKPSKEVLEEVEIAEEVVSFLRLYDDFTQQTREGKHGATAKYWMAYIDLVAAYLLFSRACRTNDLTLYVYALSKLCPVFFAANKQNYARYMVRYVLNLINMDETHPGVRQMLVQGALSVRRTNNSFARNPVDMTLEQTINADAASKLTGYQQSVTAKDRWTLTKSARSAIVSMLKAKTGLGDTEDMHKELKPNRVKRDSDDLKQLTNGIQQSLNPFSLDANDNTTLYNIATGKATSAGVKNDMLKFKENGMLWCGQFQNECLQDATRFEKSISRKNVHNFASDAVKSKVTSKEMKVVEVKGTRDLFGRLLFLATEMELDMKKIFAFPLTPVPLCLAHVNGAKHTSKKATLGNYLQNKIETEAPSTYDTYVVDAMYLIRTLCKQMPSTYGDIAHIILKMICIAQNVHFVCDTYGSPTIKGEEQLRRGESAVDIIIKGANQKRPGDFNEALKSGRFKTALLEFLSVEWRKDKYCELLKTRTLFVSCGSQCFQYNVVDGTSMTTNVIPALRNQHQEADTRIILHVQYVNEIKPDANVVVRCNDTDVLIILLYHMKHITAKVWMDTGINDNNSRHYVDIAKLYGAIKPMAHVLPAIHAFGGCDYTASFMRKGKVRMYDKVHDEDDYKDVFNKLGESEEVSEELVTKMERFVCMMYGKPKLNSLSDARFALFRQKYGPTKRSDPLNKIKGADASTLPPSRPVLIQKLKRTNYVVMLWKNAHLQDPTEAADPTKCGWYLQDGNYKILWYEGEQMPRDVALKIDAMPEGQDDEISVDLIVDSDESDYDSDRE